MSGTIILMAFYDDVRKLLLRQTTKNAEDEAEAKYIYKTYIADRAPSNVVYYDLLLNAYTFAPFEHRCELVSQVAQAYIAAEDSTTHGVIEKILRVCTACNDKLRGFRCARLTNVEQLIASITETTNSAALHWLTLYCIHKDMQNSAMQILATVPMTNITCQDMLIIFRHASIFMCRRVVDFLFQEEPYKSYFTSQYFIDTKKNEILDSYSMRAHALILGAAYKQRAFKKFVGVEPCQTHAREPKPKPPKLCLSLTDDDPKGVITIAAVDECRSPCAESVAHECSNHTYTPYTFQFSDADIKRR